MCQTVFTIFHYLASYCLSHFFLHIKVFILDLAAKLDQTAEFEVGAKWGPIEFPAPFGRELTAEEKYIAELDSKSGSSLKLTILNAEVLFSLCKIYVARAQDSRSFFRSLHSLSIS